MSKKKVKGKDKIKAQGKFTTNNNVVTGYMSAEGYHIKDGKKKPLRHTFKEFYNFIELRSLQMKDDDKNKPVLERMMYEIVTKLPKDKETGQILMNGIDRKCIAMSAETPLSIYMANPVAPIKRIEHVNDKKQLHCENGPALIQYHIFNDDELMEEGNIFFQGYFVNGMPSREDGPAKVWWNETHTIKTEEFYTNKETLPFKKVVIDFDAEGNELSVIEYVYDTDNRKKPSIKKNKS